MHVWSRAAQRPSSGGRTRPDDMRQYARNQGRHRAEFQVDPTFGAIPIGGGVIKTKWPKADAGGLSRAQQVGKIPGERLRRAGQDRQPHRWIRRAARSTPIR